MKSGTNLPLIILLDTVMWATRKYRRGVNRMCAKHIFYIGGLVLMERVDFHGSGNYLTTETNERH